MTGFGLISNTVFCAQGYFLGICFPDDESAVKLVNLILIMLWVMTNGVFANLKTANWLIVGLSKISPSRYNCEGFFRRMIGNIPTVDIPKPIDVHVSQEKVLDDFNFNYGDSYCMGALGIWALIMISLGVITINIKFRSV